MSDVIIARGSSPVLSGKTMDEKEFKPCWLITNNGNFNPPKSGNYRIFCVGNGSSANTSNSGLAGSGGGVGVLDTYLINTSSYKCYFNKLGGNWYDRRTVSFDDICIAYGAYTDNTTTSPGWATGNGVISFNGTKGGREIANIYYEGGSVSLYIPGYMSKGGGYGIFGGNSVTNIYEINNSLTVLDGTTGLGAGASGIYKYNNSVEIAPGGGGFGGGGSLVYSSNMSKRAYGYGGAGCILIQYLD